MREFDRAAHGQHTMRDFKNMKRQRGRNRGGGGGGGGKPQHNANRAFDSNGPDNVKIRGHAQHVFERYQQLARDAFSSGDRVLAENYLQHADHYFRVLRTIQPQRPPSEILGRDVLASGLDIDFEEEFEATDETASEAASDGAAEQGGGEGGREPRYPREDRYERQDGRRDGYEPRRDDRPFEGRRDNEGQNRDREANRGERQERYEGRRDNRRPPDARREDRPFNRDARGDFRPDERRPVEVATDPAMAAPPDRVEPGPGAPTLEAPPVLRSQDGGLSEAPAFLQAGAGEEGEGRRLRPRRRRAPRSFGTGEGGETPASSTAEPEEA